MTERRYSLIKVRPQDYLLPSNDGQILWRVTTYEDGPSHGLMDWDRDKTFWGAWKYIGRIRWSEGLTLDAIEDLLDWNDWDGPLDSYLPTRKAAIDSALKAPKSSA